MMKKERNREREGRWKQKFSQQGTAYHTAQVLSHGNHHNDPTLQMRKLKLRAVWPRPHMRGYIVLWQVIPVPRFCLPPLSDSPSPTPPLQEYTEAPHHWAFWLLLLFAKIAKARLVSCHKDIESQTRKMLVPKKYRFIHLVIIVCSHAMQPLTSIPLWPPPSFSFRMPKSTPTCITASSTPTLVPPNPYSLPCPSSGHSGFRWTGPARKKERKRKWPVWVGQGVPASRKCFSVPPSLWGVAADEGWSLGGLSHKGRLWALRFLGLTTH